MKAKMLKIAGVKSEAAFYKKYPTQEAFMKVHSKEFKKAQLGANINLAEPAFKPLSFSDQFDSADKMITGSTGAERQELALKQQAAAPKDGGGGGFDIGGLMKMASSLGGESGGGAGGEMDLSSFAAGKYGRTIHRAQFGGNYDLGQAPSSGLNMQQGFPQAQNSFSMQAPKFNAYNPQGDQSGTAMAKGIFEGAHSVPTAPQENGWTKTAGALGKYAGPVGDIIGGIGALQQEKEAAKAAKQTKLVSDVSLAAATSTDVDARRQMQDTFSKQRNAMMQPNVNPNAQGVGTSIGRNGLQLKGGGEIQNTYAPNTLYDDLGYEPLNDSNTKQYYHGGRIHQMQDGGSADMWGAISSKATGMGQSLMGGQNAGGKIGGTAGKAIGNAIVPGIGGAVGEFIGGIAGNALDPYGKRIKNDNAATQRNMQGMANVGMAKGIRAQKQSYMEDGGWVSHDWQPQVIASFGDHSAKDVYDFAHEGMDNLRSGGHLQAYTPPSERSLETYEDGGQVQSYALGGELRTTKGGTVKEIAENDNLPYDGKMVLFNGASHKNGGIDVEFGNAKDGTHMDYAEDGAEEGMAKVNVQGGEPGFKDGKGNFNVLGALKFMPKMVEQTGDPELIALTKQYGGMKMQNIGKDLANKMNKTNSKLDKTIEELSNFTVKTPFDKLTLNALTAKKDGYTKQSENHAKALTAITDYQSSINDTRDELRDLTGITYSADRLASHGELKPDKDPITKSSKFGSKLKKLQVGTGSESDEDLIKQADMVGGELNEVVVQGKPKPAPFGIPNGIFNVDPKNLPNVDLNSHPMLTQDSQLPKRFKRDKHDGDETDPDYLKYAMMAYNQMLPYLRPSDRERLDPNQLQGEMYALSSNQEQPVQANFYHPELGTPYDISRVAAKNDLIAQTRAAQRQVGYNPSAQAMIAAQSYGEMQKLNEADFMANQEMRSKVYGENRNILNDAKLKNLAIADQQYQRQAEAKSNTKATTQAALASIADKYAKNKLENRTLSIYENMYNYRFGKSGKAQNWNGAQSFDTQAGGGKGKASEVPEGWKATSYDSNGNPLGMKRITEKDDSDEITALSKNGSSIKKNQKNSSVVRAYKNL